jgi:hypothetical protein
MTPINLAAWALVAFTIGVFVGAVWRQTLQAVAASAAIVGVLLTVSYVWLSNWMVSIGSVIIKPGVSQVSDVVIGALNTGSLPNEKAIAPSGSWLLRGWITDPRGSILPSLKAQQILDKAGPVKLTVANEKIGQLPWLIEHHYSYWISYQPAARYWGDQIIEGGILVLAALAIAFASQFLIRQHKNVPIVKKWRSTSA